MERFISFSVLLCFTAEIISANPFLSKFECTSPNNRSGWCINIKNCPALLNMLQKNPLTSQDIEFLKQFKCGTEGNVPKVCCEAYERSSGVLLPSKIEQQQLASDSDEQKSGVLLPSKIEQQQLASGSDEQKSGVLLPSQIEQQKQLASDSDEQPPNVSNHLHRDLVNGIKCGRPTHRKAVAYVIGGTPPVPGDFPWMALLAYDTQQGLPIFACGGTIINKLYILTAAHCVTQLSPDRRLIGVRVGDYDLSKEIDCFNKDECSVPYQDFAIEETIPHPEFSNVTSLRNDIALIRLSREIDFSLGNVQSICLPIEPLAALKENMTLTVTGWGVYHNYLRKPSNVLQEADLPLFPQDQCASVYKSKAEIWHKQLCAGGKKGVSACSGDSGGPLQSTVYHNYEQRWVQFGIVSFSLRTCDAEGYPGVFTRVDYYLDWILDNMRD